MSDNHSIVHIPIPRAVLLRLAARIPDLLASTPRLVDNVDIVVLFAAILKAAAECPRESLADTGNIPMWVV